jgi:membrane protease YdiL (CAAX protease family)
MATLTDVRHPAAIRSGFVAAAACTIALLLYGNLVSIPSDGSRESFLLWTNLAAAAALLLWALWQKLSAEQIGLSWRTAPAGATVGVLVSFAAALPPVAFILLMPLINGEPVENDAAERSGFGLAYFVLLRQPLGTALFEEFAFRGVLYGAWARAGGDRLAFIATSVAFAIWHIVITSKTVAESGVVGSPPATVLGVLVSLAGLFVGGLIFAWLRWKTGSIVAPAVAHWLIVALMAASIWLVGQ